MRKVVGMLSLAGALIAALATSGYAGQTLDRVMKNKMLVEVTDQAYPPFSFVNDKGEVEGFDIDIAKSSPSGLALVSRSRRRPGRSLSRVIGMGAGTSASAR